MRKPMLLPSIDVFPVSNNSQSNYVVSNNDSSNADNYEEEASSSCTVDVLSSTILVPTISAASKRNSFPGVIVATEHRSESNAELRNNQPQNHVLPSPAKVSPRSLGSTRSAQVRTGMQQDPAEVFGTIGVDYMRVTGRMQQFKGILNNLSLPPEQKVSRKRSILTSNEVEQVLQSSEMYNNNKIADDAINHKDSKITKSLSFSLKPMGKRQTMHAMNHKSSISYRLGRRKELFEKRRKICDYALVFSMLGIIMMILENELTGSGVYTKTSMYSYALKSLIVTSTFCLLTFTIIYHAVEVQIFMIDNSVEDWRIAIMPRRVVQVTLELLASAICPIPGSFYFTWSTVHADGVTQTATKVPIDVLLSIPMFLRFYLICRVLLLHSKLFTDTSSRSIGALNRISFNVQFVMKTLMTLCPGTVLLWFTVSFCILASWLLRLCERHHTGPPVSADALKHTSYANSLWMIAITFLTVGYGDVVPNTDCGRGIAIITGIMGVGVSSLVVAVIASKLELTMAEKHVHNFMLDTQLSKRIKHAAANVLRETWLIFKNRRLVDKVNPSKLRYHQRKFLLAIYELRQVKADQRKVNENSLTLADVAKVTSITHELVSDMNAWQTDFNTRLDSLDEKVSKLTDVITAAYHLDGDSINLNRVPRFQSQLPFPQALPPPVFVNSIYGEKPANHFTENRTENTAHL